jgi:hypothetical protein
VNIHTIFLLLVIYQIKHWIADYPLQSDYMMGKFKPGWGFFWPLAAHAYIHGALTLCISLAFVPSNPTLGFKLLAFDFVVHFCMDRLKAGPKYMGRWKPLGPQEYATLAPSAGVNSYARKLLLENWLFWISLGADQMVHHLTHYACIYFILTAKG